VEQVVWNWIKGLLNDPQTLQAGLDAHLAETENHINPFRERLAVVETLISQNNKELDRALDLYLDDQFPKEVLVSRKNELETALKSLEDEKSRLVNVIEQQTISPKQIEDIHEFANNIAANLDAAEQDFHHRRAVVDALDVRVVLTVEEGEKVVYAQCHLGEEEFKLEKKRNSGESQGTDEIVRHISMENYEDFHHKNRHRANRGAAEFVLLHARHQ
jgi:hypothetical protein